MLHNPKLEVRRFPEVAFPDYKSWMFGVIQQPYMWFTAAGPVGVVVVRHVLGVILDLETQGFGTWGVAARGLKQCWGQRTKDLKPKPNKPDAAPSLCARPLTPISSFHFLFDFTNITPI